MGVRVLPSGFSQKTIKLFIGGVFHATVKTANHQKNMKNANANQPYFNGSTQCAVAGLLGVILFFLCTNTVIAQSCAPVMCSGTVGVGKNCTVPGFQLPCPNSPSVRESSVIKSKNASCSIKGYKGYAMHTPAMPASASCSFHFFQFCTTAIPNTTISSSKDCLIAMNDGLPVELMEFSLDE